MKWTKKNMKILVMMKMIQKNQKIQRNGFPMPKITRIHTFFKIHQIKEIGQQGEFYEFKKGSKDIEQFKDTAEPNQRNIKIPL